MVLVHAKPCFAPRRAILHAGEGVRRNVSVTGMPQVALLSVTQPEYGRELLHRLVLYSRLHAP